jgi:hypothetical protein
MALLLDPLPFAAAPSPHYNNDASSQDDEYQECVGEG